MIRYATIMSALALGVLGQPVLAGIGGAQFYDDEDVFLASGVEVIDVNAFDEIVAGPMESYSYTAGAYSYTISSLDSANSGLFNHDGIIVGAADSEQWMLITFTGASVNAVGGNLWGILDSGAPGGAYLTMELDDGNSTIYSDTGADNFRGVISDTAINSIRIQTSWASGDVPAYMAIDNLIIGNVVPAPGAFSLLAAAGLATIRRRRG